MMCVRYICFKFHFKINNFSYRFNIKLCDVYQESYFTIRSVIHRFLNAWVTWTLIRSAGSIKWSDLLRCPPCLCQCKHIPMEKLCFNIYRHRVKDRFLTLDNVISSTYLRTYITIFIWIHCWIRIYITFCWDFDKITHI